MMRKIPSNSAAVSRSPFMSMNSHETPANVAKTRGSTPRKIRTGPSDEATSAHGIRKDGTGLS